MNPTIKLTDGKLYINNQLIDFSENIDQILEVNELIIYRFEITGKNINNRNVGAVTLEGEKKWIIPESKSALDFKSYHRIYINENNKLIALNWTGMEYLVDIHSGEITPHRFVK